VAKLKIDMSSLC